MSTGDKTKAQLLEQVGALNLELAQLEAEKAQHVKAVPPVPEADALRGCIRALDALTETTSTRNSTSYYPGPMLPVETPTYITSPIGRVLKHLAEKYSVPLIELQVRDCSRAHVDQLDYSTIQNALTAAGVQHR